MGSPLLRADEVEVQADFRRRHDPDVQLIVERLMEARRLLEARDPSPEPEPEPYLSFGVTGRPPLPMPLPLMRAEAGKWKAAVRRYAGLVRNYASAGLLRGGQERLLGRNVRIRLELEIRTDSAGARPDEYEVAVMAALQGVLYVSVDQVDQVTTRVHRHADPRYVPIGLSVRAWAVGL